jgi:large subunit ribosomal protein L13
MKKTKFFNSQERKWILVDAKGKVLGRLASRIAKALQGKDKPTYTPNFLSGNRVIVINAKYLRTTANKPDKKIYDKYTGYPSGRKEMPLRILMAKNPSKALYLAVKGMLPKNNLGSRMLKSLKIYPEDKHNQQAQKPEPISF